MAQLRVLLGFSKATDGSLTAIAGTVITGMTNNAAFPNPPVTMADVAAALGAFREALAAQMQGGTLATAEKKQKRAALIRLLRQLAGYVQAASNNHQETLLSSGFHAAKISNAQSPLPKPSIRRLVNGISGQLIVKLGAVSNARCYEARIALVGPDGGCGPWQSGGFSTSSRSILLNGLIPGSRYEVEVRAIGGSTGISDWSDPVQHMSL